MPQTQDANVQLPGGTQTGPQVRTFQITAYDPGTNSFVTVQMQIVQIADEFGNPLYYEDNQTWQREVLDELRAIRIGIQDLINAGALPEEMHELIETARDLRADGEQQN